MERGREVDLDAFSFGDEVELEPQPPKNVTPPRPTVPTSVDPAFVAQVAAAEAGVVVDESRFEAAPVEDMQMTMEGGEVPHARNVTPDRTYLQAMVYRSHPGGTGDGHVVVFHDTTDGIAALCSCKASRNLNQRPQGCWATIDAREARGLPPVPATETP